MLESPRYAAENILKYNLSRLSSVFDFGYDNEILMHIKNSKFKEDLLFLISTDYFLNNLRDDIVNILQFVNTLDKKMIGIEHIDEKKLEPLPEEIQQLLSKKSFDIEALQESIIQKPDDYAPLIVEQNISRFASQVHEPEYAYFLSVSRAKESLCALRGPLSDEVLDNIDKIRQSIDDFEAGRI